MGKCNLCGKELENECELDETLCKNCKQTLNKAKDKDIRRTKIIFTTIVLIMIVICIALAINEQQDSYNPSVKSNYIPSHNYESDSDSSYMKKTYYCAASPCPNTVSYSGAYCSVHKSGKTKKCLQCGKAIWSDETWCDECIFGYSLN